MSKEKTVTVWIVLKGDIAPHKYTVSESSVDRLIEAMNNWNDLKFYKLFDYDSSSTMIFSVSEIADIQIEGGKYSKPNRV